VRFPIPVPLFLAVVCAYFLWFAWPGLQGGFSFDDLMNLYRAERFGWLTHIQETLRFFTFSHSYRPVGSLFYEAIYELFGFRPIAFHAAIYTVLCANLVLGFFLARTLAGPFTAAFAAILFAYHGNFEPFFTNTGYIYDALCFTFCAAAFLYYIGAARPRWWLWCGLYLLALNTKEIAVALPVWVAAWELLQPERRPRWWLVPSLGAMLTVAFIAGRLALPVEGLFDIASYRPHITPGVFLTHGEQYLRYAFYGAKELSAPVLGVAVLAMFAASLLLRSRVLALALVWIFASLLPIVFIAQRPFAAAYLPFFGLALFTGELLWLGIKPLVSDNPWRARLALAAVFLVTLGIHNNNGRRWEPITAEHVIVNQLAAQLRPWQQPIAKGQSTLFVSNLFPGLRWNTLFLAGIMARDPDLASRRSTADLTIHTKEALVDLYPPTDIFSFQLVLGQINNQIVECDPMPFGQITVAELRSLTCTPKPLQAALRPTP
jgi:hypothetical protein